ncbi:MAG: 30S ribosomal protein S20 [Selenomonadaceae bacterium]|nr:30S ribosomal protein S20 [Selenomonadaceae bacterium]MBR4384461.1 30S ribosomal protein S20 [Selenomonadaceae bacterium]
MPNIKSSVKSMKIDAKRRARNVSEKIRMKRAQKLVLAAIAAGDAAKAKELLPAAHKAIDQAAANNTIHKNAAARKKSKLALKVNAASA